MEKLKSFTTMRSKTLDITLEIRSEIFSWKAEIIIVEWLQVEKKTISHLGRKFHSLPRMTISTDTHRFIGDVLPSLSLANLFLLLVLNACSR